MPYKRMHLPELQHAIATDDDQQAYAELFARFNPLLVLFTQSIVHQREVAEEIVSDVFIRIWQRRKTLDQVQHLKMYLYVSARNYAINKLRSKNHQLSIKVEELSVDLPSFSDDPYEITVLAETQKEIHRAVNELPGRCKIIFKLVKEDGLRQKEVAELLQLSPKTIENQLAIALKKLAETIRNVANGKKYT
ncbi:MAG: RNA polymerase sigma-70 factor [Chitinophagaceae bacterium]|nr:RNA polymerase sigma-70 factor [Chitinophagaceae bacterium]MDP1763233.1 RNA polymerase sigma-70 factor [Sediminibacterium sp.]MDP1810336.1 RNA polymerase sigma-70 factor [Sediminibacterium sp.]MDP3128508.1 RNA polymerase sigma-70 factor [Sediminibacterium sp.]MDP3665582.1 RNA polymerase sigma-70 factor [Sediminibacterium sp.]